MLLMRCRSYANTAYQSLAIERLIKPISCPRVVNAHKQFCPLQLQQQSRSMKEWADEWGAALERSNVDDSSYNAPTFADAAAALPTSHPALASQKECSDWEAVLTAAQPSAVTLHQQPGWTDAVKRTPVYAVVECGSHCTRLLLSTGIQDVARLTADTHLGSKPSAAAASAQSPPSQQQQQAITPQQQGVAASQQQQDCSILDSSATAATMAALRDYRAILDGHDLLDIAAVATAAVRQAANADSIVAAASSIIGCPVQVLSGGEEGQVAFMGATASLADSSGYCLVFDMGGRSTEFAVGVAGQMPEQAVSVPLGCLVLQADAAAHQQQDIHQQLLNSATEILAAHASIISQVQQPWSKHLQQQQHTAPVDKQSGMQQQQQQEQGGICRSTSIVPIVQPVVIGTGGTITTLAAMLLGLQEYSHTAVHMSCLRQADVQQLMQQLSAAGSLQRWLDRFPWLTAARAASLLPGCAGVLSVMQQLGVQQVFVSDCDLLDGMLLKLTAKQAA